VLFLALCGVRTNFIVPSPSYLGRPPAKNHFLFNFLFGSSPDPSTEKERKVRKWFCRSGSLQKFQNDFLKTSFIAYAIRKSFFHFFTNYGATPVVNLKSARSQETPRIGCSLRSQCLLGALVARLWLRLEFCMNLYGKKKNCAKQTHKQIILCLPHLPNARANITPLFTYQFLLRFLHLPLLLNL